MKFFVTTPIFYVNAKPHIGSAYPTIAADVLARWHRQRGDDTFFLTGTDEHGAKIAAAAQQAGTTPQAFADAISAQFSDVWQALNISFDDFIRTTEARHEQAVALFLEKLKASGQIYEGEYEGLYCTGHEAFLKESDLVDGLCPDHKTKPEKLKEKNWFFKLSAYGLEIKNKIERNELVIEPASRRNEILSFIDQGLEDIAISRPNVKWGIPLPWDADQTVYVWVEALFNYCSAIGYGVDEKKFKKYWPADIHIVGKDIIKFHCVIWPALLLAIDEDVPKKVFAHGFFTVNGQKISKSLGNAIDPQELAAQYGADALRYFLLREIPFGADGDFSPERLKERYNSDLANGLGNLVSRTLNMIEQFAPNLSPPYQGGVDSPSASTGWSLSEVPTHLENLAFDKALEQIWQTVAWADQLVEEKKPWKLAKDSSPGEGELVGVLSQLLVALIAINRSLAPFLPETHEKLTALLSARPIKKPVEPLFARK